MNLTELYWRVGTKLRRTIYAVVPDVDPQDHIFLGLMDTPQLAADVVLSHNKFLDRTTFAEKEELIADLRKTLEIWKESSNNDLENAMSLATKGQTDRTKKVYSAFGHSFDIIGNMDVEKIIEHAIEWIRK